MTHRVEKTEVVTPPFRGWQHIAPQDVAALRDEWCSFWDRCNERDDAANIPRGHHAKRKAAGR